MGCEDGGGSGRLAGSQAWALRRVRGSHSGRARVRAKPSLPTQHTAGQPAQPEVHAAEPPRVTLTFKQGHQSGLSVSLSLGKHLLWRYSATPAAVSTSPPSACRPPSTGLQNAAAPSPAFAQCALAAD
jgi:hypothetical protein